MIERINLKVMVLDSDFYALRALHSYLAWDRRTRVVGLARDIPEALEQIAEMPVVEQPDVLVMDSDACPEPDQVRDALRRFRARIPNLVVLCLAHRADARWTAAASESGARGVLLRNEVRVLLVGAILFARNHSFVVTPGIRDSATPPYDDWLARAELLPGEREYPNMTERIRQALWLCVVEGMPAQLAADEMGISPHTLRSYIKEGYRILEASDTNQYPEDMGPLERAFLRFTALGSSNIPASTKSDVASQGNHVPAPSSENQNPPDERNR